MKNFWRAVGLALRHRLLLFSILATSTVVAVFWGANIGTVYPIIDIVFQEKSLQNEVSRGIDNLEASHLASFKRLRKLDRQLAEAQGWQVEQETERITARVKFGLETLFVGLVRAVKPVVLPRLPHDPFHALVMVVAFLLVGTTIKCIFLGWNMYLVSQLAQLTTLELRNEFYRRTLQMELSAFDEHNTGALMARFTNDMANITSGVGTVFGKTLREPLKMLVCFLGAALISWRLLLLSLVVAPICVAVMYFLAKSIKRANRRAMEEMSRVYGRLAESFAGIEVVKAYTMERVERARFQQTARQLYRKTMRITYYGALTRSNNEMLGVGIICLSLLAGGYLVLTGDTHLLGIRMSHRSFSIGSMMLFYGFLIGVSDPARKLADVFNQLQGAAAAADRVYPMLDRTPTIVDPKRPKQLPAGAQDLRFDDVSFAYQHDQLVLHSFSLRIEAGKTVAIVGPNGCGKSTLMNLLLRFYDPGSGVVSWGGTDLREAKRRDLRRRIALVTQQTWLFDDTIAANIRYGSPHASDEQVVEAAKQAFADSFIDSMEYGYETSVGEAGGRLSGGQRQRIALARAFLRDPDLLILDEATSQVDQQSERLIQNAIDKFAAKRTCLFITHRMSACVNADTIVVMDDGRLIATGRHDELLATCPMYQRLSLSTLQKSA